MAQVPSSPTLSHSPLAANLSSLPNRALLDETKRLAANERSSKADLIIALREVDSRRLYLAEGHSCMFFYCTRTLWLSEQAAYSRIEVARVSRVFPQVLEALVRGALSLTTAVLIAPHLTSANVEEWISAASFKSKREVDRLIAARHPKPNVPTVIRRQSQPPVRSADQAENHESAPAPATQAPAPTQADETCEAIPTPLPVETRCATADRTVPLPVKPAVLAPLSATTYKIQFTADQDTHDKLRHAQALLRHQIPSGDMGAVINKALTLLIADVERKKFGIVRRPRGGMDAKDAVHAGSRTIPAAVRRAVAARVGFSTHRLLTHQMTVAPFALDREIPSVRAGLVGMLMAEGLFLKEAEAMVETWSTTWFEEGTRVFYIVPKPLVERTLPLDIRPGPGAIERVFVGRLEIAAPWLLEDLQVAFARFDRDRFAAHGRFLEPFSQRLLTNQSLAPAEKNRITSALAATTQAF